MRPRPGRCLLVCLGFVFLGGPAAAAIELPQSDGSVLSLEAPATRVVTLAPSLAEIAYAAGAGGVLVATVEFSDYPEAASRLPRIGDAFRFDLERILALKPDLVMAWTSGNPAQAVQRLEALGLKVWRIELRQPEDIATLLRHTARAAGVADNGAAAQLETKLDALAKRYAGLPAVRYFYQVAERPLFTLNGAHIVSQGLSRCGAVNVFAAEAVLAPQVSREAVLAADPEVLLAPRLDETDRPLAQWLEWPHMTAVKHGALVYLPADEISRASPRMLDSLELACKLLHQFRNSDQRSGEEP
jgi:iron complex transport system substrate-binding protein